MMTRISLDEVKRNKIFMKRAMFMLYVPIARSMSNFDDDAPRQVHALYKQVVQVHGGGTFVLL